MTISPATLIQPTIWETPTAEAQVGDVIRKPYCPIARVVGKEILKDGRTCLIVDFPGCRDRHTEEWVLSAVEVVTVAAPAAIKEDNAPQNSSQNRQFIVKPNKVLAVIFGERQKEYQQFLIIREELAAIGIKLGKLINNRNDAKSWRLDWDGDKAGLYWTVGNGWEVASLKYETELTGNWEGFDLIEHLACNGIDLDSEDE